MLKSSVNKILKPVAIKYCFYCDYLQLFFALILKPDVTSFSMKRELSLNPSLILSKPTNPFTQIQQTIDIEWNSHCASESSQYKCERFFTLHCQLELRLAI